jgi:transposase
MLADETDFVIGGDTHRDRHTLAVLQSATGGVVATLEISADRRGYRQALRFAARHAAGRRAWALEGTGSYGAGLTRTLQQHSERVVEVDRPARRGRRSQPKDDRLDAIAAARAALGRTELPSPRSGGSVHALRALLNTREGAIRARTAAINELRALLLRAPDELREELRGVSRGQLLARCRALRPHAGQPAERYATLLALRVLARRIAQLTAEADQLERELLPLIRYHAPQLLEEHGVGTVVAAQVLVAWSHSGRFDRESRFARLAGVAPIPASSGQRVRHRLDRGGDRQLNRALHTVILCRHRRHPATTAYLARRQAEGKSRRDAVRCLKRYLARHLWRLLEHAPAAA